MIFRLEQQSSDGGRGNTGMETSDELEAKSLMLQTLQLQLQARGDEGRDSVTSNNTIRTCISTQQAGSGRAGYL